MIGQRLRQWRKKSELKIKELADMIGYSQGGLSEIENGKAKPSTQTLLKLVQHTNINLAWLLTGKGPMEWPGYPDAVSGVIACYGEIDDISARILLLLKDMTEEERRETLRNLEEKKFIREMIEKQKGRG